MAKVRIMATDEKYRVAPYFIAPKWDEAKKKFITGQEDLTDEEKKKVALVINPEEDSFMIKHMQLFDDEVEHDRIILKLVKMDEAIALSKSKISPGMHRFYIENKEDEAVEVISKADEQYEAMTEIRNMSVEEMSDLARILGTYVRDLNSKRIESDLKKLAQENPKKVLIALSDKDRKIKVFLNKLIDKKIVSIVNGKYMNGIDLLGANQEYAIHWLKDPVNSRIVTQWNQMMGGNKPKENVNTDNNVDNTSKTEKVDGRRKQPN